MPDLTLTIGAEYGEALTGIRTLGQQYAAEVAKFDRPINPTVDTKAARSAIAGLAENFKQLSGAANASVDTQRNALAALAASGQKGTAAYQTLLAETKLVVDEQGRLKKALADVDRELGTPHELNIDVEGSASKLKSFADKAFDFNNITTAANTVSQGLQDVVNTGAEFEAALAAVGAITGQSGAQLDKLGVSARSLATTFGTSATDQLASYQGILSKLGAQVADTPAALQKIAENVNILSAASGDAADTSMSAIIDSMLQFGLVTGNSSKDAETSTRVINALAASAQVGAAEIPQVAEAILQAGVAAKGAQQSFESTNAAIQVLALGGKTGSEAGIALRNVLGLLQKASGPAEETMRKLGTSSADLGKTLTEQGLDAAITKIKIGMNGLGSAAERNAALMQIFGTENSAAAGILIDNVGKLKEFQQGIIDGEQGTGAAFEQAAVRMNTTEASIRRAEAAVKDGLLSIFSAAGSGLSSVVGASAKIVPLISTLQGLKTILPEGLFSKAASGLKDLILPLLIKMGVVRVANVATLAAETTGELANAGAKGVQAVATEAATGAQIGLNAAMSINPVFLIVAGIAALGIAVALFVGKAKSLGEATDDAAKSAAAFQAAQASSDGARKAAADTSKLTDEYDKLTSTGKRTAEQQARLDEITGKLSKSFPGATDTVDKYDASGRLAGTTTTVLTGEIKKLVEESKRLEEQKAADAMADLKDSTMELGEAIRRGTADIEEMKKKRDSLNTKEGFGAEQAKDAGLAIAGGPVVGFLQYIGVIETAEEKQKSLRGELKKQSEELDKAKQAQIANVELYREQGFSVAQIAEETGLTVDEVKKYHGELTGAVVSSGALERSIAGLDPAQQKAVRQAASLGEGYKAAQTDLSALQAKLAQQKQINPNVDTKALEEQIAAATEKATAAKLKFDTFVDTSGISTTLEKLPADAKAQLGPLADIVGTAMAETKVRIGQENIGDAILKASEIKGELDASKKAQGLIDQFKNAKSDVERQQIGKVIADTLGPAVATYDAVSGRVDVNIEKAQQFADTQKKAFSGDIVSSREKFAKGLGELATQYEAQKVAAEAAGEALRKNTDPSKTAELSQRWRETNAAVEKTAGSINDAVTQGRKVGLVTGDVKEMGNELGFSAQQAKNVAEANGRISTSAKAAAADVKSIAAAYREAKNAADSAATDSKDAVLGIDQQIRDIQKALASGETTLTKEAAEQQIAALRIQRAKVLQEAKDAAAERRRFANESKALDIVLGDAEPPKPGESPAEKFAREARNIRSANKKLRDDLKADAIADEMTRALAKAKSDLDAQLRNLDEQITAKRKEAGAGDVAKALEEQRALIVERGEAQRETIRRDSAKKTLELYKKQLTDENKAADDASKLRIEFLKIEESAQDEMTSVGIARRSELRQQAAKIQLDADIRAAVTSNAEYIAAYAELARARATIASTTATDAERAAARDTLGALEDNLEAVEARVLASDERITLLRRKAAFDRDVELAKTSIALFEKQTEERLAAIRDDGEREYETKKAAVAKQLAADLLAFAGNEEAKAAAHARATAALATIDKEYREQTDAVFAATLAFRRDILKAFSTEDLDRIKRETDSKLEANLQQERDLRRSLLRRKISEEEFNDQLREVMKERGDIVTSAEKQKLDAIDYLNRGASVGLQTILDANSKIVDKSIKKYGEVQDGTKKITEGLGDILTSGAVQIAAITAKAAVEQKNIAKAAALATLDIAISLLAHLIPIWIASLYGKSIETLGPAGLILGAVAAGVAVTLLSALKAQAEGATFHEGHVPKAGAPRRERWALTLENEAWINPTATARNLELLEFINRTNEDGEVFFRNRISRSVYGDRVHAGTVSPIVIVIQAMDSGARVDMSGIERRLDRLGDQVETLVATSIDTNVAANEAEFTRGAQTNALRGIRGAVETIAAAPPPRERGNPRRNLWK